MIPLLLVSACSIIDFNKDDKAVPTGEVVNWWEPNSGCKWTNEYMCGKEERPGQATRDVVMRKLDCGSEEMWQKSNVCVREAQCVNVNGQYHCVDSSFTSMPTNE